MSDVQQYQLEPANADTVAHFKRQWNQIQGRTPGVNCECGLLIPLRHMFRCLYCGCWFCQACAEVHFGKTRKEYAAEAAAKLAQESGQV